MGLRIGWLFREWNEVDFPKRKPNVGFGKAAKRNERNNCSLLLSEFREIVPHSRNNKFLTLAKVLLYTILVVIEKLEH